MLYVDTILSISNVKPDCKWKRKQVNVLRYASAIAANLWSYEVIFKRLGEVKDYLILLLFNVLRLSFHSGTTLRILSFGWRSFRRFFSSFGSNWLS